MLNIHEYPKAEKVFSFFEQISAIPHGSTNTDKIADYLVRFAKERGLFVYRDAANNVLIRKPASNGRESRPTVILQGHTDMVAQKKPDSPIDMNEEGLTLYRDGDFLRAKDTTLGGDDGVAVAYELALLDDPNAEHPELEALFTSDEEIGLIGADLFDASVLRGKIMLNLDSDNEGVFTVGCAGGIRVDIRLPIRRDTPAKGAFSLKITGLKGGHSGAEIDKGRANAIKLGVELLRAIGKVRPISLTSGSADNAIPREFLVVFAREGEDAPAVIEAEIRKLTEKYKASEPDIAVFCESVSCDEPPMDEASSDAVLDLLDREPNGVTAMSRELPGLVETSLNIGILKTEKDTACAAIALRSAKDAEKNKLLEKVEKIAHGVGATTSSWGDYPAWEYHKDSRLQTLARDLYFRMSGKEATIMATHGGLECGIFSNRIEGLDCISLGPDNFDIHTTEEHLSISSTARVYEFLKQLLKEI